MQASPDCSRPIREDGCDDCNNVNPELFSRRKCADSQQRSSCRNPQRCYPEGESGPSHDRLHQATYITLCNASTQWRQRWGGNAWLAQDEHIDSALHPIADKERTSRHVADGPEAVTPAFLHRRRGGNCRMPLVSGRRHWLVATDAQTCSTWISSRLTRRFHDASVAWSDVAPVGSQPRWAKAET
jgi:hypothetical protein